MKFGDQVSQKALSLIFNKILYTSQISGTQVTNTFQPFESVSD